MATVPDRFIREKKINFEDEILSCYGVGMTTQGRYLPPLTLGVMSMLELLDNNLFKGEDATAFDYGVIFYLLSKRSKAVNLVAQYSRGYKKPLERAVKWYIFRNKISLLSLPRIQDHIETAFTGFDMLPRGGSGGSLFVYGSETIANTAFICCEKLNKSYEDVLWNTPLTLIGHVMATHAQYQGVKGVGRRKDEDHLKFIFARCKEFDEQEKLYPWQWLEPEFYALEPHQTSKKLKRDYDKRLKEVKNGKVKR